MVFLASDFRARRLPGFDRCVTHVIRRQRMQLWHGSRAIRPASVPPDSINSSGLMRSHDPGRVAIRCGAAAAHVQVLVPVDFTYRSATAGWAASLAFRGGAHALAARIAPGCIGHPAHQRLPDPIDRHAGSVHPLSRATARSSVADPAPMARPTHCGVSALCASTTNQPPTNEQTA